MAMMGGLLLTYTLCVVLSLRISLKDVISMCIHESPIYQDYLENNHQSIGSVCLGWGNHIDRLTYLKEARDEILAMLTLYDFKWHCLGITQTGHPIHPSPLSVNTRYGRGEQGPA